MPTLLSQSEANLLVKKAWEHVAKHQKGSYRFGQALWNLLPDPLVQLHAAKEADFYFVRDSDKVMEIFYKYFVDSAKNSV